MVFVSFLVTIYYNVIIAWSLYYLFAGMKKEMPWAECGRDYNSMECYSREQADACIKDQSEPPYTLTYWNNTCIEIKKVCEYYNYWYAPSAVDQFDNAVCFGNERYTPLQKVYARIFPSEDYFNRKMLGMEEGTSWQNYGLPQWENVLCLLGAWVIVCLCLINGIKSSGKAVYFTALFPYLVITIFLIRGAFLDGAKEGIKFYVTPDWNRLGDFQVWADATTQIFYSLSNTLGGLVTLSSYNRFNNNCQRDSFIIAFANCFTSVYAGFATFSILGYMAKQSGVGIGDVIQTSTGLAFIVYPQAVLSLPITPFWCFIFFVMLITLGLDSAFAMTETLTTAIMDQWPQLRKKLRLVVISTSVVMFILGLSMTCPGGIYMYMLFDSYAVSWSLLILAFLEVMFVSYVYGFKNFFENIAEMSIKIPKLVKYYWLSTWLFFGPIILPILTITSFIFYSPASYGDYVFPKGYQSLGWLMASTPAFIMAAMPIWEYFRRKKKGMETWREMFRATEKWREHAKLEQLKHANKEDTFSDNGIDNPSFSSNEDHSTD